MSKHKLMLHEWRRGFFNEVGDPLFLFDPKTSRLVDANLAAQRATGFRHDELLGRDLEAIFSHANGDADRPPLSDSVRATSPWNAHGEYLLVRKEAPSLHVTAGVSRIQVGPDPLDYVVVHAIGKHTDTERSLRLLNVILEAVCFSATQFLTASTWESCAVDVLRALGEATGMCRGYIYEHQVRNRGHVAVRRSEWHATGTPSLRPEADLARVPLADKRFGSWGEQLSRGQVIQGNSGQFPSEARDLLIKNGVLALVVLPVFVGDSWWGEIALGAATKREDLPPAATAALQTAARALGTAIQRHRSDEATLHASRMEATATLAAGVAHDFNNLMVGVLGNADLLRYRHSENDDEATVLDEICASAQRAGELARQMLMYARGSTRGNELVDLNRVVRDTIGRYQDTLPKGVRIDMDLVEDMPLIEGDATQLSQVVMNLCVNAVESLTDAGLVGVTTGCVSPETCTFSSLPSARLITREYASLCVSDNGIGMDARTRARVFEPFFTTKFQGRGLGLASVYGIVRDHGGSISVESQPQKGTTVRVYLPTPANHEICAPAAPARHSVTVLVIDDEESVLRSCERMLLTLGHRVLLARSGQEAVEIAGRHVGAIHVALLDMAMPGLGGAETYARLARTRPDMHVLICSGFDLDNDVQAVLDSGATGFISKPFRIRQLSDALRRALD